MGLFDKLFDKKECAFCGAEIGLLGNRKLEDGNMCKDCAAKLSPYLTDRRHTTVQTMQEHLAYRERNREQLKLFQVTRVLGNNTKVYIDEDKGWWLVASRQKFDQDNPDIFEFSQVTGCDVDVDESRTEIKKENEDGKKVSYDPPRYDYSYNFYVTIHVNSEWCGKIRFRVNTSTIDRAHSVEYKEAERQAREIERTLTGKRQEIRDRIEQEKVPKKAVICPFCKATTTPDDQGRCEFCLGPIL